MRVLVVKTSSLGDIIHTLPALTDAAAAIPGIRFDWMVEESFVEVPAWHPSVENVIPVAIRRWRKNPLKAWRSGEWRQFKQHVSRERYDLVIDAQGLLKSAFLTRYVKAAVAGLDKDSARESAAARFYDQQVAVAKGQPAVERTRQLFALALGYDLPEQKGHYNLAFTANRENHIVLLHGTTWASKHWPEAYWQQLARQLVGNGFRVLVPWGSKLEKDRATAIAADSGAEVLPRMSLTELAQMLNNSAGCIAVDTGLGHLAAAVGVPTVALFGATNSELTGFYGENQLPLQANYQCSPCMRRECQFENDGGVYPPCYGTLLPQQVFDQLQLLLQSRPA